MTTLISSVLRRSCIPIALACFASSGPALASAGGATGLNIGIDNSSYTLDFGSFASVVLQDATALNTVRWYEGGDGTSGVGWNNGYVTVSLGSANIQVTSFPVNAGTPLNASFFLANYTSANGAPYGQWSGGTNTITSALGVGSLGMPYYEYGTLGGRVNIEGTHTIGGGTNPPSNDLLYGVSFTSGGQTGYGWFDIGITTNGLLPSGYVTNSDAGSYAMANDPVYFLTLNGYGFSTDGPVAAGVAAVPEPETYALMMSGLGVLVTIARRKSTRT